ncbi:MAG: aminotransferase class V-fold PLP-dependent enzyme, partial [Pseudomonadota bacterium]
DALRADTGHAYKAVLAVQVDTSTSVKNDIPALRQCLDRVGHPALLMVDCIACLGCDRFEMDAWGVDVMVAGCQKGLMTPPGLGFVFFNDRAAKARESANCVTHYWDWTLRADPEMYYQYFDGTAPTHHLYGLREALDMIQEEGLETVWERHTTFARAVWAALDHWGQEGDVCMNIADPALRSTAVTTVRTAPPEADALRAWCETQGGVTLGIGLGMVEPGEPGAGGFFRIGHMGHLNPHMVLGGLSVIEAGMIATGITHRPGGVTAAARVLAGA